MLPLIRTPFARYVPLKPSVQLPNRNFPVSAAATRSFSATTFAQLPVKAKSADEAAEDAKHKRGRPPRAKVEAKKKKNSEQPPPRQPVNTFIRFIKHYYATHETKQVVSDVASQIKHEYYNLSPEEKKQFLPTEEELATYHAKRAEWLGKIAEAKSKAKLTGYQLYVSTNFPKDLHSSTTAFTAADAMKEVSAKWSSLTNEEKAEWSKRATDQYKERNSS